MMPVSRAYACVSKEWAGQPQSPRRALVGPIIPVHDAGLARRNSTGPFKPSNADADRSSSILRWSSAFK
jgi:hypothetical protein